MKYNGQNIICDSDITMTGQQIGHSLSEVITSQQTQIDSLKSNVKWIYKYGGVGSGSGTGGSSDGSSGPIKYIIEVNDQAYTHNSEATFSKAGRYKFRIQLFKIAGRTFDIKITYPTKTGVAIINQKILPVTNPEYTTWLDLTVNGDVSVTIIDDEGNNVVYQLHYVVSAYDFYIKYVYKDNDQELKPSNNNIYVGQLNNREVCMKFTSIIAVDIVEGSSFTYTDWGGKSHTEELIKGTNDYYLPLGIDISNENAGNYTFTLQPQLTLSGKTGLEEIDPFIIRNNLIPSTCYLKIEADRSLYKAELDPSKVEKFLLGAIPFRLTPYQGILDETYTYDFKVKCDGNLIDTGGLVLVDQTTYIQDIFINSEGWHNVTFTISRKGETYTTTQYFYAQNPADAFLWYPKNQSGQNDPIYPTHSYKYIYGLGIDEKENFTEAINEFTKSLIKISKQTNTNLQGKLTPFTMQGNYDQLIAIGIKYDPLNDYEKPILQLRNSDGTKTITLYQNQIIIYAENLKIYLPLSGFHLLTIYKRAVGKVNGNTTYEWNVYLDGVLEGIGATISQNVDYWSSLTLYSNQIVEINYIEISYFEHSEANESSNLSDSYILNPIESTRTYFNDLDILYHFYSYKTLILQEEINQSFKDCYYLAANCFTDYHTNRVKTDISTITNIAQKSEIPVLLLNYLEPINDSIDEYDGEAFLGWMEKNYDVTSNLEELAIRKEVTVQYSPGQSELTNINIDSSNHSFFLYLQGTSTLLYRSKNFDLAIEPRNSENEQEYTYFYSPNFDPNNSSTFLPETRFTIKADMVDSSHSNNATIGKFVNSVCTKFEHARQQNNTGYEQYVKNALEGFPVLVFLCNSYYKNRTDLHAQNDYYFLGVNSFNLGRDSAFNLGYKDLRLLNDCALQKGKWVYKIPTNIVIDGNYTNPEEYLTNFGVAEIQENKNYFDFSQFDRTILYPIPNVTDSQYMFGKIKTINDGFETNLQTAVRYVALSGGYIFDQLEKNMLESPEDNPGYSYEVGYKSDIPSNYVSNYKRQLERSLNSSGSAFSFKDNVELQGSEQNLRATLLLDESDPDNPVEPYIDYIALSEYYVICMAFGLIDSVVKNLNLKTWNNKTFYTAFYDMDTSLGKDNAGNDSNYTCFSDYWAPNSELSDEEANVYTLKPAISYKDWFDKNITGYDIPSSYLFALVKYGMMFLDIDNHPEIRDWYPGNVWARMRRGSGPEDLITWSPARGNRKQVGSLRSADYFIETYYGNYTNAVADCFFNLNYRKKYGVFLESEVENIRFGEDRNRFSGRRLYYVHDWIDKRFKLLDLYFNLGRAYDPILVYNTETNKWEEPDNRQYPGITDLFLDPSNKDCVVLQSAFTTSSSGNKYSVNIETNITGETFSPMVFTGDMNGRYIIENQNNIYQLSLDTNGKFAHFGGSKNWTTISNINGFILNKNLYISSDKLKEISGYNSDAQECNTWNINSRSLEKITLNSTKYSGDLTFTGLDNTDTNLTITPNLYEIDIDDSNLGLNLTNLQISKVHANNINKKGNSNLSLVNCNNISELQFNNSKFSTITIAGCFPLVGENKTNHLQFSNNSIYVVDKNGNTTLGSKVNNNYVTCQNLNLTYTPQKDEAGTITIGNSRGDNLLKSVTLSGFSYIYIHDCKALEYVQINNPETVKELKIIKCGINSHILNQNIKINSDEDHTVDLSKFTSLESLSLRHTCGFTKVILASGQKIDNSCFCQTNIQTLDGSGIKLSNKGSEFSWAWSFTLKQSNGDLCSFNLDGITNLTGVFEETNIELDTFKEFNSTYYTQLQNVTNTSNMWLGAGSFYNTDLLLQDYKNNTCSIDLSMYRNVQNANGMFSHFTFTTVHPQLFNGFGVNGFTADNLIDLGYGQSGTIKIPYNWAANLKNKLKSFNYTTEESVQIQLVTYDSTSQKLIPYTKPIKVSEFFNTQEKLTNIAYINFTSDVALTITNDFKTCFSSLKTITNSFCGSNITEYGLQYNISNPDGSTKTVGFLYERPDIAVEGSFGFNNFNDYYVDYDNFIDWTNSEAINNIYKFISAKNWDANKHVFGFKKIISNVDTFYNILQNILTRCTNSTLAHVFENCLVLNQSQNNLGTDNYLTSLPTNRYITSIPYLFNNLRLGLLANNEETLYYWDWGWDIMYKFPKVVSMNYTFSYMRFSGYIPFNLFRRRVMRQSNVYVDKDSVKVTATRIYFEYDTPINSLISTFEGCNFEQRGAENITMDTDKTSQYCGEFVYDEDDNTYDYYYLNNSASAQKKYVLNYEFQGYNLQWDYNQVVNNIAFEGELEVTTFYNFTCNVSNPHPNLPTDIFYACSLDANLTGCFQNSNICGYLSDYLFKGNCTLPILDSFLKGTILLPKLYKEDKYFDVDIHNPLIIYYYIGHDFVKSSSLNNAFNANFCLSQYAVEEEGHTVRKLHVFSFIDSFPNGQSFKDFLPNNINFIGNQDVTLCAGRSITNILLNIMYDHTSETVKSDDGNIYNSDDGKWYDSTGEVVENPNLYNIIGKLGFQSKQGLIMYPSTHLINNLWMQFWYGNIIATGVTYNKLTCDIDDYILEIGDDEGQLTVSVEAIFPKITAARAKTIKCHAVSYFTVDGVIKKSLTNTVHFVTQNQFEQFDTYTIDRYTSSLNKGHLSFGIIK